MRVAVQARFTQATDEGRSAIGLAIGLDKVGVDVTVMPLKIETPVPSGFSRLLSKIPSGPPDVVVVLSDMPGELGDMRTFKSAKTVGYMRLRPMLDPEAQIDGFDAIVVTSPEAGEVMAAFTSAPVGVVAPGVDLDMWPVLDRSEARPVTVMDFGDPEVDAGWDLYTDQFPSTPLVRRKVTRADVSASRLLDDYRRSDMLIAIREADARRGMEMIATGGVLVAPVAWEHGGHAHEDAFIPLPGFLIPLNGMKGQSEIMVHPSEIVAALRRTAKFTHEVRRGQQVAANAIRPSLGWEQVAGRFVREVTRLVG